jgi:hypothetical protein
MNLWMRNYTSPGDALHSAVIAAHAKIKHYYDVSSDCYTQDWFCEHFYMSE